MKLLIKKLLREYYDDFDDGIEFNDYDFEEPKKKVSSGKYMEFKSKLPEKLILYRILIANSEDEINKEFPGSHYSLDKVNLLKNHSFLKGKVYFLLSVSAKKSLVDIKKTVENNILYPNEKEVTLKNKGKGANIISITKLT